MGPVTGPNHRVSPPGMTLTSGPRIDSSTDYNNGLSGSEVIRPQTKRFAALR